MNNNSGNIFRFRPSRQTLFSFLAVVMAGLLLLFIIYAIGFLLGNINVAFEMSGRGSPEQRFDIKGYEALKLQSQQ